MVGSEEDTAATPRNSLLFPPGLLFGNGKCQVQLPRPVMGAKHSHRCDWLRTGAPQVAVTPTLPMKHLPTPFLARSPFSSKGTWDFPSDRRSLDIPPATEPNAPLLPGGLRVPVLQKLPPDRWPGGIHTNDKLKQQKSVTLAQVASSLAGGCFFHAFPWSVAKEASVSWVDAPREACRVERKDV